jgi:hexosaminidase
VVMTPGAYCYFDAYQADPVTQPEAISGYLPLSKVYSYEPVPKELDASKAHHVLGAQANVWTEYMPNTDHVEYMVFPRLLALAEVVWSDKDKKDWFDFKERLQAQYLLLQRMNVNYYRPSYQLQIKTQFNYSGGKATVSFDSEQYQPVIRYTLDDSQLTASSQVYNGPFDISGSAKVKAAIFKDTARMGPVAALPVDFHKALGKKVTYNKPYSTAYVAQKDSTLTNGYRGTLTYSDGQWQGFLQTLDIVIDMEQVETLNSLSVNFMQLTGPGVYMPLYLEVSLSADGKVYTPLPKVENDVPATQASLTFKDFIVNLEGKKARYIKVFADEVIVY